MALHRKLLSRKVQRTLDRHAQDVLENLIIPGAYDGLVRLHYAALTPGGIVCVQRKHCRGIVSGGARDPQWQDDRGSRRYRFLNPVIQNEGHVEAVSRLVSDVPVTSLVVFTGPMRFAGDIAANVVHLSSLEGYLETSLASAAPVPGLDAAWKQLKSSALTDDASRRDLDAQLSFG